MGFISGLYRGYIGISGFRLSELSGFVVILRCKVKFRDAGFCAAGVQPNDRFGPQEVQGLHGPSLGSTTVFS